MRSDWDGDNCPPLTDGDFDPYDRRDDESSRRRCRQPITDTAAAAATAAAVTTPLFTRFTPRWCIPTKVITFGMIMAAGATKKKTKKKKKKK